MHTRFILSSVLFALAALPLPAHAEGGISMTTVWPTELPAKAGDTVTFTANILNGGSFPLSGVIEISADGDIGNNTDKSLFTLSPELNTGCRHSTGSVVLCDFGPIGPGLPKLISIKLRRATWCDSRTPTFSMRIVSTTPTYNLPPSLTRDFTLDCPVADLDVTVSPVEKNFVPGDPVTVHATVKNNGPADAALVDLVLHLPRTGTILADGTSKDITCAPYGDDDYYVCRLPNIASGKEKTVDVRVALTSFDIPNCKAATSLVIEAEALVRGAEDIRRATPSKDGRFYPMCPKGTTAKGFVKATTVAKTKKGPSTMKIDGDLSMKPKVGTPYMFTVTNPTSKPVEPTVHVLFLAVEDPVLGLRDIMGVRAPKECVYSKEHGDYTCTLPTLKAKGRTALKFEVKVAEKDCNGLPMEIEAETKGIEADKQSAKLTIKCVNPAPKPRKW